MDQGVLHSRSAQPIVATTTLNCPVFALTPPCHLLDEQPTSVNLPEPWNQLLIYGVIDEDEEKLNMKQMEIKKQLFKEHAYGISGDEIEVKQENTSSLDHHSSKRSNRKHPDSSNLQSYHKSIKPKVEASTSGHGAFKVRKEKLGDRITALHQLVSPFGKVLGLPYMGNRKQVEAFAEDLQSRGLCLVPVSGAEVHGSDYWSFPLR